MRRKRNDAFYDIAVIGNDEATDAVEAAESFLATIAADIHQRFP